MGWRDVLRSPDPSRALYLAMRANPTASRAADIFQGGFEGAMEGLGRLGHAASIPARAIAGAAYNTEAVRPVDVSDYALYGRDMETGLQAVQYGDLLAGTMEDAGEIAPGGVASKLLRLAGNAVTDPMAAPALLSGAEAVGALGGSMSPFTAAPQPSFPRMPRSRAVAGYGQSPPSAQLAPPGRGMPGGGGRPKYPGGPRPLTSAPAPRPGQPGGPVRRPGVQVIPQGPGPGPTATQPVPMSLQGTGAGPVGLRTQQMPVISPEVLEAVRRGPLGRARALGNRG